MPFSALFGALKVRLWDRPNRMITAEDVRAILSQRASRFLKLKRERITDATECG